MNTDPSSRFRAAAPLRPAIASKIVRCVPDLPQREMEVLARVAGGGTNAEVAGEMGVSVQTVRSHLEHVFGKLGVNNRVAAASAYVLHWALTSPKGQVARGDTTHSPPAKR